MDRGWDALSPFRRNTRIEIEVDISRVAGAKGLIRCDVADTGSTQIPAVLVTQLLDLGYSGWPAVFVTPSKGIDDC